MALDTQQLVNTVLDRFEPKGDVDRLDNGDGIECGNETWMNRFYNSLRRAPLRKLLALTTYIVDIILVFTGLITQKDLPIGIASGFNVVRCVIYGGYFGSSAWESVVDSNNKTKQTMIQAQQLSRLPDTDPRQQGDRGLQQNDNFRSKPEPPQSQFVQQPGTNIILEQSNEP